MLDKGTEMMLQVANTLTAEDLDVLRESAPASRDEPPVDGLESGPDAADEEAEPSAQEGGAVAANTRPMDPSRGERERSRTRESKTSTVCVGREREKHNWWPVGTELAGRLGSETFTATVVENPQVKSGRSLVITSGPANGKVCLTPTRAAIEATEAYRQAQNWGRSGVTNGWDFWKPAAS
jgi:hypothetical protein